MARPTADVAGAVAFLLSADADDITGTTLFLDGGLLWNCQSSEKAELAGSLARPTFRFMKATLTSKGQITIPLRIRKQLGLKPGLVVPGGCEDSSFPAKARSRRLGRVWKEGGQSLARACLRADY